MNDLFIGRSPLRLRRREGIRRAALMSVPPTKNTSQSQDQKSRNQCEEYDVDELKAFAHNHWITLVWRCSRPAGNGPEV
jgi:hypothetical protein